MSADRTPLQAAAKRVYEALEEAEDLARAVGLQCSESPDLWLSSRVERDIQTCKQRVAHLMHEEDCE